MSDRSALLAAIAGQPDEDTPRLVYADWLEEFGETDFDRATVEFIRMTCHMKKSVMMRPSAYIWISLNWHRLVPSLLALRVSPLEVVPQFSRQGRIIKTWIKVKYLVARSGMRACRIHLDFHRGLLRQAIIWSAYAAGATLDAFAADHPQARLNGFLDETPTFAQIVADPEISRRVRSMYDTLSRPRKAPSLFPTGGES